VNRLLAFTVDGRPVPQPRPQVVRGKGGVRAIESEAASSWKATIALYGRLAVQSIRASGGSWDTSGTYTLTIIVRRARAAGDVDNFLKAAMDGLNGIAWRDDSQVRSVHCRMEDAPPKGAAAGEYKPGLSVQVLRHS
jgi:Holliday junction resolvase RusA-like endonuclease